MSRPVLPQMFTGLGLARAVLGEGRSINAVAAFVSLLGLHLVMLLVWLGGTGGKPESGPQLFYEAALQRGYRLLALSYLNTPAVSQVCAGATLRAQPACARHLRQHRAWGEPQTSLVADRP